MRRNRKFWTRERIIEALRDLVKVHGNIAAKDFDKLARDAGEGLVLTERPYPTGWTVRLHFGSMAEAFAAAGLEPPLGTQSRGKRTAAKSATVSRPRSTAFVDAKALPAEAVAKAPPIPCPGCAVLHSERDELAWVLREVLNGSESAIRLVRAGLAIGANRTGTTVGPA